MSENFCDVIGTHLALNPYFYIAVRNMMRLCAVYAKTYGASLNI